MARALIVGCGCRGRLLGSVLLGEGWQVRGTSRTAAGVAAIDAAGFEAAEADPDRAGTITDLFEGVTVVAYLMGSALGNPDALAAIHGPRLERILEKCVDSPVRRFVYEATGSVGEDLLATGARIVADAAERWRIPAATIAIDPADHERWLYEALDAVRGVSS